MADGAGRTIKFPIENSKEAHIEKVAKTSRKGRVQRLYPAKKMRKGKVTQLGIRKRPGGVRSGLALVFSGKRTTQAESSEGGRKGAIPGPRRQGRGGSQ